MSPTAGLLDLVVSTAGPAFLEDGSVRSRPTIPGRWIREQSERAGRAGSPARIVRRVGRRAAWVVWLVEGCATSREVAGVAVYFGAFLVHLYESAGGALRVPSPEEVSLVLRATVAGASIVQPELLAEVSAALRDAGAGRLDEDGRGQVEMLARGVVELLDRCWTPPVRLPWASDR